jgi:hypothetical protein
MSSYIEAHITGQSKNLLLRSQNFLFVCLQPTFILEKVCHPCNQSHYLTQGGFEMLRLLTPIHPFVQPQPTITLTDFFLINEMVCKSLRFSMPPLLETNDDQTIS